MILVQTVIVGTAALGMTVIMISGGIDLSVGSVVALVSVVVATAASGSGWQLPAVLGWVDAAKVPAVSMGLALLIGAAVGVLCGSINGLLVTGLRVVPFIITLGTLKVYRGMAKWLSNSTGVYVPDDAKALVAGPDSGDGADAGSWLLVAPGSGACWR